MVWGLDPSNELSKGGWSQPHLVGCEDSRQTWESQVVSREGVGNGKWYLLGVAAALFCCAPPSVSQTKLSLVQPEGTLGKEGPPSPACGWPYSHGITLIDPGIFPGVTMGETGCTGCPESPWVGRYPGVVLDLLCALE